MTEERLELPAQQSIALSDASKVKVPGDRSAAAAPMSASDHSSITRAENSELERRLLALERVLQALVAYMAEVEPKVLARLTETFCLSLRMTRPEHDYIDTDSYAAELVRSVVRLGDKAARKPPEIARGRTLDDSALSFRPGETPPLLALPCIQVRQAGGVWHVTKDGRFYGDFLKEEDALQAVEAAGGADATNLRTGSVPPGVTKEA